MSVQKSGKDEPAEEEDSLKHIDPLHQLIQLFSRTALTEKWYATLLKVASSTDYKAQFRSKICNVRLLAKHLLRHRATSSGALQLTSSHHCNFLCNVLKPFPLMQIFDLDCV